MLSTTSAPKRAFPRAAALLAALPLFTLALPAVKAQTSTTFALSYDDPTAETVGNAILQTSDGGYLIGGQRTYSTAGQDAWLAKFDSSGAVVWQQAYHGGYASGIAAVQPTSSGGFVVAGSSAATDASFEGVWVANLDGSGNILWQMTYSGGDGDGASTVHQTADGFIVGGASRSFPPGTESCWILTLDPSGNVTSQQTFNTGIENESAGGIQPTSDGGYFVAGSIGARMWAMKLDSGLNLVWTNEYGNTENVFSGVTSFQQTSDGGYILGGWEGSGESANLSVIKLDSSGNVTWQNTYSLGAGGQSFGFIQQTSDGGYILTGGTAVLAENRSRLGVLVLKLDPTGAITWQNVFDAPGQTDTIGFAVRQTADSGYLVTGWYHPLQVTTFDGPLLLLKLNSAGTIARCPLVEKKGTSQIGTLGLELFSPPVVAMATNATIAAGAAVVSPTFATSTNLCK